MRRRIVSICLVLLIILPLCFVTAFAAEPEYYTFALRRDDALNLVAYGDIIPSGRYALELYRDGQLFGYTSPFTVEKSSRETITVYTYDMADTLFGAVSVSMDDNGTTISFPEDSGHGQEPGSICRVIPFNETSPIRPFLAGATYTTANFFVYPLLNEGHYYISGIDPLDPSREIRSTSFELKGINSGIVTADGEVLYAGFAYPFVISVSNSEYGVTALSIETDYMNELYLVFSDLKLVPVLENQDSNMLGELTAVVTSFFTWIRMIAEKIVTEPLLLVTVGIFFVGACIGIFGRFLGRD